MPEGMSAKTRVEQLCRAGVGHVESVRTSLGFTLVGLCTVPAFVQGTVLVPVCADAHPDLECFSSFHRNGL